MPPPFCLIIQIASFCWDTGLRYPAPQVEPRKLLVAAVVAWTDIAVEFAVVEIGQPLLEIVGLRMQPFDERLPDFGDERVGLLPGLEVGNPVVLPCSSLPPSLLMLGSVLSMA